MTTTIKRGFGVIAFFAVMFFLAAGVRSAETEKQAPATSAQSAPQSPAPGCPCMMGKMGERRPMPGAMGAMMSMAGGMGMPAMEMDPMAMTPMMHEHMMRMMAHNPKLAGKMMEMRADIMRAVADVLTKYGKEMESGQWPAAPPSAGEGD